MGWRAEVARRLRTHLDGGPGTRMAVVARRRRDIDELCEILPGAIEFRLSDMGLVGGDQGTLDVVVAWLIMTRFSGLRRRRILGEIRDALRVGGTLVVVDHNQPRSWWGWLANMGWCLLRGVEPYARPAYPVAREMKEAAFEGISLRIAFRERVQIVRGIRPPIASDMHGSDDGAGEAAPR